jgi:hypothetical protein
MEAISIADFLPLHLAQHSRNRRPVAPLPIDRPTIRDEGIRESVP